jgi:hypothetical protein
MSWTTVRQEVRRMRFEELNERRHRRELTMAEAAERLGITERTFRRWRDRYDAEGVAGLQDRRLGRASARAVPVDEALRLVTLYETRYTGWTVKHFTSAGNRSMAARAPIRGLSRPCRPLARSPVRLGAERIARSGRANPCPA